MRRQEKVLLWSSNLWMLGDGLFGPLFAIFAAQVGGNIFDITLAWSIFMIVTGVLTIMVGKWGDIIGHERLLITGYALNAVFTFAYLLVSSPMELFFVQAGMGVSLALANPTWYALYDRYSSSKKDGYIWGIAWGHGNIATGVAILIGGYIVTEYSFTALFIIMGILQTLATLLQLDILRKGRS